MEQPRREKRFLTVIDDNRSLIYKVCYMYADDSFHFQDLYQEILANIWEGLEDFRAESMPSTWIYRVAINTCVTFFRRHKRHSGEMQPLDAAVGVEDDNGERLENLRQMYRLISRLDKIDKAIILMWLDGRNYDEISEVTGFSRSNVAVRLTRIKQKLIKSNAEEEK